MLKYLYNQSEVNNLEPIENSYSKLLNWKRISVNILAVFFFAAFASQVPDLYYHYKVKKAILKVSSECPIEIADAFRLDSIKIIDSKEVCLFITDELGQVALKDTTRLKEFFVERTKGFTTNSEFQSFLKQGYTIGFDLKDYLQNPVFKINLDPSLMLSNGM